MTGLSPTGYHLPVYDYVRPPELSGSIGRRYRVAIVGAGLAGLTLACDLASRGIAAVVLDEDDTVGVRGASSRGICYAQKSLEIFDRLGIYHRIRDKGVTWSVGKVLRGQDALYRFDLAEGSRSAQPPFINIQQFYVEWFLVDRIRELGRTDLRWKNRVTGIRQDEDSAVLTVETPDGAYNLEADWVIDASGHASRVRQSLGLPTHGELGEDRWCISDVRFHKDLPVERWTWVEAPFNENRAVWQHLMADGVWRMDYQMLPNTDPNEASRPEVAAARLRDQLGPDVEFDLIWVGAYAYRTQLMGDFRHGKVFFIGDAAHVKSPFGARGGNSGIQDAENLAWKLTLVLNGQAPETLLDSYNAERRPAAVENIAVTRRSGRFLAPRTEIERLFRTAVMDLAAGHHFARLLLNTGRMCVPHHYGPSPLTTGDAGQAMPNLTLGSHSLAGMLPGDGAGLLALWCPHEEENGLGSGLSDLTREGWPLHVQPVGADEARALGMAPGAVLLIRPDLHLAARLPDADAEQVRGALARATGRT
ncbi:FAD-dependent oxidoreductase [Niveispirillum sp. KHB5.9]|uniref:FAD-dependent oxidoreductase n=1 Tax=Niveispirillum sp. KHB5.9 TaxID=3400269 RepID=UPI003A84BF6F